MAYRFTVAEKWEDRWFRKLSAGQKLIWLYLLDKCDWAGFWEVDVERMAWETGVDEAKCEGALEGLARGLVVVDGYVWIRNFLKHQKNLPLNPDNRAHKGIILRILEHPEFHEAIEEHVGELEPLRRGLEAPSKPLPRGTGIGKGKGIGLGTSSGNGLSSPEGAKVNNRTTFKPPTLSEIEALCSENGYTDVDPQAFVDHYEAKGWMIGRNRMKSWPHALAKANREGWAQSKKQRNGSIDYSEGL